MGIRTRRARAHSKTHFVGFGIAGIFGFIALLVVTLALSLGAVVTTWLEDLPDYTSADAFLVAEPTRVYDADGNEIVAYYLQNRRSVELDEISDYVKRGVVDTEDTRFYQHNGIDVEGILRAVVVQLTGGSEGGSTITQQLVRNTVLSDEQFENSLRRKVREAYIAIQMEKTYTKDQILNMYLNTIFYGNGAYGIEAASITYFNKHASDLTLNEAATLVGIPNSPTAYDPFTNYEACKGRRNVVLQRMLTAGTITQEQYDDTVGEEIPLNPGELTDSSSAYPYFTDYVHDLLLQDFSSDIIQQGGLNVYTTLEPDKQEAAEKACLERVESFGNDTIRSALVSVDNSNGHIVAMVGGQYYGVDKDAGQSVYNLATAKRQPGSSFKMFVLVAAMLDGMSPTVKLDCRSPMQITSTWNLSNNAGAQYGIRTLASATAISSNTAYAQVGMAVGLDKIVETAHLMGIDSDLDDTKPALTIGGSDGVSPIEMAEAYSTLANAGLHRDAIAITRIEDRNGNVVYEHDDNSEQVIDSAVAVDAIDVLEGVVQRGQTGWYVASYFTQDQPVAGKTGTSNDADNFWFCGFTPQLTTIVWCGDPDTSGKTLYINGSLGTTQNTSQPIWCDYMNVALEGVEREEFPTSDHTATYKPNDTWDFVGTASSVNATSYVPTTTVSQTYEPEVETTTEEQQTDEGEGQEGAETPSTDATTTTEGGSDASTGGGDAATSTGNGDTSSTSGQATTPTTPTTPTPTTPTTPTPTTPTTPTTPDAGTDASAQP